MGDFKFLENPISGKWVVLSPRRAKRPNVALGFEPVCPFCLGREGDEREVYRVPVIGSQFSVAGSELAGLSADQAEKQLTDKQETENREQKTDNWLVRVLNNKYPFAPIHEVIIHSPDHAKNFDELPLEQVEFILKTYRNRYNEHSKKGHVYIFHNRGEGGGESLPHPHSQLAVIPFDVKFSIPRLDPSATEAVGPRPAGIASSASGETRNDESGEEKIETVETDHFYMFCPQTSQWPDEVWVAPKRRGRGFGEITDEEITDFAFVLQRIIQIFDLRHGSEFPFNFYIYPGGDWYLRLIPRLKVLGGFEIGTGIFINTQDPDETIKFIKEHFEEPDTEKIKSQHQAEYSKRA